MAKFRSPKKRAARKSRPKSAPSAPERRTSESRPQGSAQAKSAPESKGTSKSSASIRHRTGKGGKRTAPANAWLLRCAPGLGRTAQSELRYRKIVRTSDRMDMLWQRNHDVVFLPDPSGDPKAAHLRLTEEVHRCLIYGRYKISAQQLDSLAEQLRPRGKTWRLVVTADGTHFNRHDLKRFVGRELNQRGVRTDDSAAKTAFIFCVDQAYYVTVPEMAARDLPGRDARQQEREGSLPPTIAAAMVFLARPGAGEAVLDPVCGSGTLLAEASAFAPDAALIGRDLDSKAVTTARQNLDRLDLEETPDIAIGDARELDVAPGQVSLVLANLPFGKQFGDVDDNPLLYRDMLKEMRRLAAKSGWRGVILAGDGDMVADAAQTNGMRVDKRVNIRVRGEPATIVLLSLK